MRGVTTAALQSIGYTPMVAASAQEALRMCAQSGLEIRLILTDVVMPEMTVPSCGIASGPSVRISRYSSCPATHLTSSRRTAY